MSHISSHDHHDHDDQHDDHDHEDHDDQQDDHNHDDSGILHISLNRMLLIIPMMTFN